MCQHLEHTPADLEDPLLKKSLKCIIQWYTAYHRYTTLPRGSVKVLLVIPYNLYPLCSASTGTPRVLFLWNSFLRLYFVWGKMANLQNWKVSTIIISCGLVEKYDRSAPPPCFCIHLIWPLPLLIFLPFTARRVKIYVLLLIYPFGFILLASAPLYWGDIPTVL